MPSMSGRPRCPQAAFRVDEEHSSGNDEFTSRKSVQNFHPVSNLRAEFNRAGFEPIVTTPDKDVLRYTSIDHRIAADSEGITWCCRNLGAAVHARA